MAIDSNNQVAIYIQSNYYKTRLFLPPLYYYLIDLIFNLQISKMFRGYFGSFLDSMMGGRGRQSSLDKLLDGEEPVQLEQILADSEVLNEMKWANQKLMNYFDHDKVAQLIDLVTKMPPEDATHDQGHKFPFVASEIFNCELSKINDLFFTSRAEEEEHVDKPRKQVSSSPLPKDDEDEDEDGEAEEVGDNDHHAETHDDDHHEEDGNEEEDEEEKPLTATAETGTEPHEEHHPDEEEEQQHAAVESEPVEESDPLLGSPETKDNSAFPQEGHQAEVVEIVTQKDDDSVEEVKTAASEEKQLSLPTTSDEEVTVTSSAADEQPQTADKQDQVQETTADAADTERQSQPEAAREQRATDQVNFGEDGSPLDDEEEYEISTAPSTQLPDVHVRILKNNKYELFERLLSFLDSEGELNAVLCGYFQKTFAQLVSNKAKEVYSYIYSHTSVLDNLVRHSCQRSIADVLIKLLNTSDNLFYSEMVDLSEIATIKASFVRKLMGRLSPECSLEDHLNVVQILTELADVKPLQAVLLSEQCFEQYISFLVSDSDSTKRNTYLLLQTLIAKTHASDEDNGMFKMKTGSSRRYNDSSDGEDDAKVEQRFYQFVETVIKEFVVEELKVPAEEEHDANPLEKQYGQCRRPFGMLRLRVVEFVAEAFKAFFRVELHQVMLEIGLYNSLLFFFDHYPFHNMLHLRVCEIFTVLLDKAASTDDSIVSSILDSTHLLRKILDTAREGARYTLQSTGLTLTRGHVPFVRKLANKLHTLQGKNDEVANFLDSIPEWADYLENDLKKQNELESKQLGQDSKKKTDPNESPSDEYFDLMFKINSVGGSSRKQQSLSEGLLSGGGSKKVKDSDDKENGEADDDNEEEEEDGKENHFGSTRPLAFGNREDDDDENGNDDSEEVFDRIMFKTNTGDDDVEESNGLDGGLPGVVDDLKGYYSSNTVNCSSSPEKPTPHFNGETEFSLDELKTETKPVEVEKPEYHAQFFWKDVTPSVEDIDQLLQDYE